MKNSRPEIMSEAGSRIIYLRNLNVILDSDIAELFGVSTKRLNEQVRRNKRRFPSDFMFQLSIEEKIEVVAKCDHLKNLKFSSYLPLAFTEHGTVMLASVLNSEQAVRMSVEVVRAFNGMRNFLTEQKELAKQLNLIGRKVHQQDEDIRRLFEILRKLVPAKLTPMKRIGYKP